MRKIFTLLLLLCGFTLAAQQYNNEWINFNQTYYKFKVATAGVYRIPKTTLDAMGIGNTPVENFELWRNGQPVPFYPSVPTGTLPTDGYIEIYGEPNDGKADKPMYRDPAYQHTDKSSLQTDTAVYFLSINTNQSGYKISPVVNNVAGNILPVEPYFMYTHGVYYRNRRNAGFAAVVGEYVFSSSFDKGEYWSSSEIKPTAALSTNVGNLRTYAAGPGSAIRFGASGNALNTRTIKVRVNGNDVIDTVMDYFNDVHTTVPFSTSLITGTTNAIQFVNTSAVAADRMVISYIEITYPRQFNFDNKKIFEFTLPAKNDGYFLNITNFNHGGVPPVLYDLYSRERFVGDISTPSIVKFALPGSTLERKLVLLNEQSTSVIDVTTLTTRNFRRYTDMTNQGDFLLITNPVLYTGSSGNNPVIDYKNYRESSAGGSHKVVVTEIDELVDQFAFGIKKHPLSVRNFIRFARTNFGQQPKYVFLVGRGMTYTEYNTNQSNPIVEELNLVPTFGNPASDNLLSSADLSTPIPATPIGRLSVVRGSEIEDYLEKVIEYEQAQRNSAHTAVDRHWMKNVVHVTGSSDPYLGTVLCNYMGALKQTIEDTAFGGKVTTFCKTSTNPVEQLSSERLSELFHEGISFLTYFGHSSSTTLEFNIDNPQSYENEGKYPVFYVNGCNAGNFFTFYPQRLLANETLSEKFTLAKKRGTIAFTASTHFGIVNYLNLFLNNLYHVIGREDFGKTLGEVNRDAFQQMINATGPYDFYARLHAEEITLHGDPALQINSQPKPDYYIDESLVRINPAFISLAETSFKLKLNMINLGRAIDDSIRLEIKQQYPDGNVAVIFNEKIAAIHSDDSLVLNVPILPTRDKGGHKITITLDADNVVDEMSESNNTVTKEFFIYEDEARPVYPYAFSIVNTQGQKLFASTANPFNEARDYIVQVDTTELFNSSLKTEKIINAPGGILEIDPGISYLDSTVYYWRISINPEQGGLYQWSNSSFTFINSPEDGFGQSHYYQHLHSNTERVTLDTASKQWKFGIRESNVVTWIGSWVTSAVIESEVSVTVNDVMIANNACGFSSIIFMVFDPVTFKPWVNVTNTSTGQAMYGSWRNDCSAGRTYNFEFRYTDTAWRHKIMNFMDNVIPDGYYVIARSFLLDPVRFPSHPQAYVADWMKDTTYFGSNNSIYHKFLEQGFTDVDSFNRPRQFVFIYKKNDRGNFLPEFKFTKGTYDKTNMVTNCITPDTIGYITSPKFGPAKAWKEVFWQGVSLDNSFNDNPNVEIIGIDNDNYETVLYTLDRNTHVFDVSSVDPQQYPYLQLRMRNIDSVSLTPYQLKSWRIHYDPVPEGAIATNLFFTSKDSVEIGQKIKFGVAFKNISKTAFDSLAVKVTILDNSNVPHAYDLPKHKPIQMGDTIMVFYEVDTKELPGNNTLLINVNPENNQPEQHFFNNFLYRDFYVHVDKTNPLLDVTFDGVHILNRDIVSAKPNIQIKLKDESEYLLLNDTSLATVQLRYPNGTVRTYTYDNDTLRFIPASDGADNTALIEFTPAFTDQVNPQGDEYELIVKGKDRSGNRAGDIEFRVSFRVITKPMISNLLNYPNPFSTSTAFVFTITGSELPQNMKIQVLTVTGKIVREITMNELGPLHIGRNITEFKWDGTDQYGQKLANGVYLYRVVTTLNGKQMDKYRAEGDNTDKFFNNGYGKMYLMR